MEKLTTEGIKAIKILGTKKFMVTMLCKEMLQLYGQCDYSTPTHAQEIFPIFKVSKIILHLLLTTIEVGPWFRNPSLCIFKHLPQ
jgi:hypothetical protein